jgi:serine/threonine-protein kinase
MECGTNISSDKEGHPAFTESLESPTFVVTPGTVLVDRYEIQEKIGEGGMGEVYRAQDRILDRQVAIKVLPSVFAMDKERLARFEREAKLLAALNHTNIAAIYGLETFERQRFLVLELAEGESLKARLDRGPMDVEEALEFCRQVAEGLEAAHEKGIIHRDLKPGNIMISPEGNAKILDFGLAKAFVDDSSGVDVEASPTITAQMTRPGVVLGTAAYMSPEQARGRAVDKRTDVWAFGCVLYECLTGMRSFHGDTVSDTLAHILKGEPDWSILPMNTPANIMALLRRCLRKDRRNRLHDIADARIEFSEMIDDSTGLEPSDGAEFKPRQFWLRAIPMIIVAGIMGIVAGIVLYTRFSRGSQSFFSDAMASFIKINPGERLTGGYVNAEETLAYSRPSRLAVAISPDGEKLVYAAVEGSESNLYVHQWDQSPANALPGTSGAHEPFFSPDGNWLAFWQDRKLKKVSLDGGPPITILEELPGRYVYGASWGEEDRIVFSLEYTIWQVSATGGRAHQLTQLNTEAGELSHRHPFLLPGGKTLLFTVMPLTFEIYNAKVVALDLESGERRDLIEKAADARYVPTGHLVFVRLGSLMATPFDLKHLERTGAARTVLDDVMQSMIGTNRTVASGVAHYTFSKSGSLIYVPGGLGTYAERELMWVNRGGEEERIAVFDYGAMWPKLSPDGERIAFRGTWTNSPGGSGDCIYIYDIARDDLIKRTPEGQFTAPVWEPDGINVTFGWDNADVPGVYRQPWDGSEPAEMLFESRFSQPVSWTPDGSTLIYMDWSEDTKSDIWIYKGQDHSRTKIVASEFNERHAALSPDGKWIAYTSDSSGTTNIYVRAFKGMEGPYKISIDGGTGPAWGIDGKELFFAARGKEDGTWDMCVADIRTSPNYNAGRPRVLFSVLTTRCSTTSPHRNFDISNDGTRFLMIGRGPRKNDAVTEVIIVQNWFDELKRLVPTGK